MKWTLLGEKFDSIWHLIMYVKHMSIELYSMKHHTECFRPFDSTELIIVSFRQAKRRRLTLDSLNSSNAEIELALKTHRKSDDVVLNINTTPTEEENKLLTEIKGKLL